MTHLDFFHYTALTSVEFFHLIPMLLLALGGLFIIAVELVIKEAHQEKYDGSKKFIAACFFLSSALSACVLFPILNLDLSLFGDSLEVSSFTHIATALFSLMGFATVVLGTPFHTSVIHRCEYLCLLFFGALGMTLMVHANDLVLLFVSLELMSLCIYVLISSKQDSPIFVEGSLKYFLLGSFASAFLLMGIALIYGAYGTTNYSEILEAKASLHPSLFNLGAILVCVGIFFKFGLVPFHMYLPDAYQAAPSQITQYIAIGVKTAMYLAGLKVILMVFNHDTHMIHVIIYPLVVLSVIGANLFALKQHNIKRMLAYSSIAHAGYLAVGLLAITHPVSHVRIDTVTSILVYLIAYGLATLGIFALLVAIEQWSGNDQLEFDHFRGFAATHPILSVVFLILMISLAGLPVSAGFIGKYMVFLNAIKAGEVTVTVIAILGSMISLYYYFRIPVNAFLLDVSEDPSYHLPQSHLNLFSWPIGVATVCAGASLALGILPHEWLTIAARAVFHGL